MVKGSVTITLDDFQTLLESNARFIELQDNTKLAFKEFQVFLSYICNKEDMSKYIEEFNRQSKTSSIVFENGRAKIKMND